MTISQGGDFMDVTLKELVMPVVKECFMELLPFHMEEVESNIWAKHQQTSFNQTELAERLNVSTATIRRWRARGLPIEPSPTTELNFNLEKVEQWKKENGIR